MQILFRDTLRVDPPIYMFFRQNSADILFKGLVMYVAGPLIFAYFYVLWLNFPPVQWEKSYAAFDSIKKSIIVGLR